MSRSPIDTISDDMMLVLPGMVLGRADALDLWRDAFPWVQFEIQGAQVVPLVACAAVLTYRVALTGGPDVATYRAQCTTVYRRAAGRWRVAFQQQTPLSPVLLDRTPTRPA